MYDNADIHQQGMLYDRAIDAPDASIRNYVLVRTRGRTTGSTCRILSFFEHIEHGLNPRRRRQCEKQGHNFILTYN